jgi:uracil-DNA glycosylase
VDNEPTPFWSGDGEAELFADWKARVGWSDEWGEVSAPARGTNGPSGTWVEQHVLRPLRVDRAGACISDCLDTARLNASQGARIEDTYTPVAEELGLPRCTVPQVPAGEPGIVREARAGHLSRLRTEIETCRPDLVVTLGNAALRVLAELVDDAWSGPRHLDQNGYGEPIAARVGGRSLEVLPLVHPRSGERTPPWPEIHRRWVEAQQT